MATQVLLIGGNRFLGRTITEAFIGKGYEVYEMNRGTRPPAEGITEHIVCDKADRGAFAKVLNSRRWDVVVDTILNDDDLKFVVETVGSKVGQFIHTGSLGVYGEARRIPVTESMPLYEYEGEYVVFNYKIKQDQVVVRAFQERGFPGTILRMSNIYGPGDIPLDGWGGRSAEFFRMLRDGKKIPLPSEGRALLHPGHVKDLGRAFLNAAEWPDSIGQIYNICGPDALMTKDYVMVIAEAMGVKPNLEYAPVNEILVRFPKIASERGMKFATQHMCASIAKAERDLGWRPEIPLEAGMRENIEWMKKQGMI